MKLPGFLSRRRILPYLAVFSTVSVCLFLEWWWAKPQGEARATCAALRTRTELARGEPMNAALVSIHFRPQPSGRRCEEIYFTEKQWDLGQLRGGRWLAARTLAQGEWLAPADAVIARRIGLPRGKRAYSARFETKVSVAAGDYVEIFSGAVGTTVVQTALVLESHQQSSSELVLALSPEQIRVVEKAIRRGTLSVARVHPEDIAGGATARTRSPGSRRSGVRPQGGKRAAGARIWNE